MGKHKKQTVIISAKEKEKIQGDMNMYDPLWEEHPKVKEINARAKAQVEAAWLERDAVRVALKEVLIEVEEVKADARVQVEAAKIIVEAKLKARMEDEARIRRLREALMIVVQVCFPNLVEVAQQASTQVSSPEALNLLLEQICHAVNCHVVNNEDIARAILGSVTA